MTGFEYLSVLLSIILGLAITQVLEGYRTLLLARRRVRWQPLPLVWSGLILLFAVQAWWASFGLRTHNDWSFGGFLIVMAQMALLYLMAAVVLPDVPDSADVDLAVHFEDQRQPFFACLVGIVATSIAKDRVLDGIWPAPPNLAFHIAIAAVAAIGLATPLRTIHAGLALGMIALFAGYVWLLFARL